MKRVPLFLLLAGLAAGLVAAAPPASPGKPTPAPDEAPADAPHPFDFGPAGKDVAHGDQADAAKKTFEVKGPDDKPKAVKLGAHIRKVKPRTLHLSKYLKNHAAALPPIPAVVDYSSAVKNWPMYLNDRLGICTVASVGHIVGSMTTYAAGSEVTFSNRDLVAMYSAVAGFDPATGANDNGANMTDVMNYWTSTGLGGHKALAYVSVNLRNPDEVRTALYLFGPLDLAVGMPIGWQQQTGPGMSWKSNAGPEGSWGGHSIPLTKVDPNDPLGPYTVITWGAEQHVTQAGWQQYFGGPGGEGYAVLTTDWLDAQRRAPNGVDWAALRADWAAISGQNPGPDPLPPLPTPTPTPVPPPGPNPPGPVPPPPADGFTGSIVYPYRGGVLVGPPVVTPAAIGR